jgi:hypothetical protein
MNYPRFFAMIITSTLVMFALMYFNTYLFEHIFWSETRAYMAVVMGAAMAIVMLAFMFSMYPSRKLNLAIFTGAAVLFTGSLWLVRSQVTVEDRSFMSAMIPHHSIAIMTSSRANISDSRVKKLSDEIVYAQDKEIAEMRYLIADIEEAGERRETTSGKKAKLVSAEEALSTEAIETVDPEFLTTDEVNSVFPSNSICTFTYTKTSPPVLVLSGEDALLKISGDLVALSVDQAAADRRLNVSTPGISISLSPVESGTLDSAAAQERQMTDLVMELDKGHAAGFRGYFGCND